MYVDVYIIHPLVVTTVSQGLSYLDRSTGLFTSRVRTVCPSLSAKVPLLTQILRHLLYDSYSILGIVTQMGEVLSIPFKYTTPGPPTSQDPSLEVLG